WAHSQDSFAHVLSDVLAGAGLAAAVAGCVGAAALVVSHLRQNPQR
nr:hypothetical protein [Patulibacter sp.]